MDHDLGTGMLQYLLFSFKLLIWRMGSRCKSPHHTYILQVRVQFIDEKSARGTQRRRQGSRLSAARLCRLLHSLDQRFARRQLRRHSYPNTQSSSLNNQSFTALSNISQYDTELRSGTIPFHCLNFGTLPKRRSNFFR